jgi:exodeoxyribonuclease V alpha subunit
MSAQPEHLPVPETVTLKGILSDVRYVNPMTQFVSIELLNEDGLVHRACGTLANPIVGEHVTLFGAFSRHSRAGRFFEFERFETKPPEGLEAQIQYLANATGLTERMAKAVIARFGHDATTLLERCPERLLEVGGLSKEMIETARERWSGSQRTEQASTILTEFGINESQLSLLRRLVGDGDTLYTRLRENPYLLYMHLKGIGWKRIDAVAQRFKIPTNHPARIEAGFLCLLRSATAKGHTTLSVTDLLAYLPSLLAIEVTPDSEPFVAAIQGLAEKNLAVLTSTNALCLSDVYAAENTVVSTLQMIEEGEREFDTHIHQERLVKVLKADLGGEIEAVLPALRMALDYKVCALDMPDNALRFQTIRALHHVFKLLGGEVRCTSIGQGYIHRLHEQGFAASSPGELVGRIPFGPPKHNRTTPLEVDLLIVERADAMGVRELALLLDALPSNVSLVLIGDSFELPPQGPGRPFYDLIQSDSVPVQRLELEGVDSTPLQSMRTALRHDAIPKIGQQMEMHTPLAHLPLTLDTHVAVTVLTQFHRQLYPSLRLVPFEEVAICALCSPAQMAELNHRLRDALNPEGTPVKGMKSDLREGDWVVFTDTLLEHHIIAGTRARISGIHPGPKLRLEFMDHSHLLLHPGQCKALRLGYVTPLRPDLGTPRSLTVLLLLDEAPDLLTRQALYQCATATTRLIIVGDEKLLSLCFTQSTAPRFTRLGALMTAMKE